MAEIAVELALAGVGKVVEALENVKVKQTCQFFLKNPLSLIPTRMLHVKKTFILFLRVRLGVAPGTQGQQERS